MAGLPGTGLGGIFYALLVIWMAVRETWRATRGSSHAAAWAKIARLGAMLSGIVAALWAEGWLLQYLLGPRPGTSGPIGETSALAVAAITPALAIAPFLILAALMLAMHAARLLLPAPASAPLPESP